MSYKRADMSQKCLILYFVLQEDQSEYHCCINNLLVFLTSLISSVGFPTDNLILLDEY